MRVLHLAPHPDDEVIGAPATLMALRDEHNEIFNYPCSFGRRKDWPRRRAEVEEACRRAGFTLIDGPGVAMSRASGDDLGLAEERLRTLIDDLLAEIAFDLVVSPSPHDRHPGHELVGRAAAAVLAGREGARWWMWGLWADLPLPTIIVPFGDDRLREVLYALDAHRGEVVRNDYRQLVSGRASANRILSAERVFDWSDDARKVEFPPGAGYAELVTEAVRVGDAWRLGRRGLLAPRNPLAAPSDTDVGWWIAAASVTQQLSSAAAGRSRSASPTPRE